MTTDIDEAKAIAFNAAQLTADKLTTAHMTELVAHWQEAHDLAVDGMAGDTETIPSINRAIAARAALDDAPLPVQRCHPLRELADGRRASITSAFGAANPSRRGHTGIDVFYPYLVGKDPAMKVGDGGREKKWWIPDETRAIAVADGKVILAGSTPTGYHVRVGLAGGWSVGYFHLSRLFVVVGQFLQLGDQVGVVGDNPIDRDARHLHFELYRGHTGWRRADPEQLLAGARWLPALARL